jgi:hypothetical protein
MMIALSDAARAFYLFLITVCFSICLVWALWVMDQKREPRERTQTDDQRIEARPRPRSNSISQKKART